ncbi:MAG: phenylacetate--CoA ligase family protein [bacterium]
MNPDPHPGRQAIESGQLAKLRALLSAIVPGNRFYTSKFQAAGLDPAVPTHQTFRRTLPFTTKRDLVEDQQARPPYGTTLTFPVEQYTRFSLTSGTTGHPIRWLDTPESWAWMVRNKVRVFAVAGLGPGDRVLFPFSFGPFLGFWLAYEAALSLGCLCFPAGGLSSIARLKMILENQVTGLCCTPTYAIRLGGVAREENMDLGQARVKAIFTGGEPGGCVPEITRHIERLWPGARVYDHHGMTETGSVTYACPQRRDVLHVIEASYIAEVIEPETGQPVTPGTVGELVLTNLGRVGSPLLRYRTGDLVRPQPPGPCACGSHEIALKGGILGRLDDMVVIRGVNVYPVAVEKVIRAFDEVMEYRVEVRKVRGMQELTVVVELVPGHGPDAKRVARLQKALKAALALTLPVTPVPAGTLPRFDMKAKRWVRV